MAADSRVTTAIEYLYNDGLTELLRAESSLEPPPRYLMKYVLASAPQAGEIALRHDYDMVVQHRLGCMLTPLHLQGSGRETTSFFEDLAGIPLGTLESKPTGALLQTALQLVDAIEEIHEAGLIHQDLHLDSIRISDTRAVILDFSRSTRRQPTQRDIYPLPQQVARLHYMAPELSGRMNHQVDERADLYSLGAILFKLFTGTLPFQSHDPHALIYQHLAVEPPDPLSLNPDLSRYLGDILMHLLAKDPRYRYQRASDIRTDLELAQRIQQGDMGAISGPARSHEAPSSRLEAPRRLYGREKEREALLQCFEDACSGQPGLLVIGGHSGVGKTTLIRETYIPVTREKAFFVSGKFEQFQGSGPYGGWLHALGNLLDYVLAEAQEAMDDWCERLQAGLGRNTAVIAQFLPRLEVLLGPQPEPAELPPMEARERFQDSVRQFIEVFSHSQHPLVIFLDDLQWADPASLKLLAALYERSDPDRFLLILAYRDNEVPESHPFHLTLTQLPEETRFRKRHLSLQPLSRAEVDDLLAEALHLSTGDIATLGEEIFRKTAGNPFFVWQLLRSLQDNGWLYFDSRTRRWRWQLRAIQAIDFADHVVDLMLHRFGGLASDTHYLLSLAACLGTRFELEMVAALAERHPLEVWESLQPALEQEFILPGSEASLLEDRPLVQTFRFVHDRMQEAAYQALPGDAIPVLNYRIARLMLNKARETSDEDRLILEIAGHLNAAVSLIDNNRERLELTLINLRAARRAKDSAAFATALDHLRTGMGAMPDNLWEQDPELAYELFRERGELEYLNGEFAQAESFVQEAIQRVEDPFKQCELYRMLVVQYTLLADYSQAIDTARQGLRLFGVELPTLDYEAWRDQELAAIHANLNGRPLTALGNLPPMTDRDQKAIMQLLIAMGPPCYRFHPRLWSVIVAQEVRRCLTHGVLPAASYSFPAFGGLLMHVGEGTGDDCRNLYNVTLDLIEHCENPADRSMGYLMMGSSLKHWFAPVPSASQDYLNAYESGLESGNLQYAVYGFGHNTYCRYFQGTPLDTLLAEVRGYLAFTRQRRNRWGIDLIDGAMRILQRLHGERPAETEPEETYLERCRNNGNLQVLCIYHILSADADCLLGQWRSAAHHLLKAEPLIDTVSVQGLLPATRYYALRALVLAYQPDAFPDEDPREFIHHYRDCFRDYAIYSPESFGYWYDLLDAELSRLDGELTAAMTAYDAALEATRRQRLPNATALVTRLAAGLWEEQGKSDFADLYWQQFHQAASQWQAPALLESTPRRPQADTGPDLDLPAVIRIAEALSLHTDLSELVPEIIRIVAHQTGAQRVALLLQQKGNLVLAMDSYAQQDHYFSDPPPLESRDDLPHSVLRYVTRTRNPFRFSHTDISNSLLLRSDDYFAASLRAGLEAGCTDASTVEAGWCVPLMVLGECVGALYLEHRLIGEAFDDAREALVEFLAAQAAISIRSVGLINQLSYEAEARREAELKIRTADAEISMRKEHEQTLRQLATTDFLTGLPNRRTLLGRLEEEWNRQQRNGDTPAVLLMLDVDHFKQINDRHGHAVGDQVLCDLADLFRQELRNFDLPARLGGEEFAMLLKDVGPEQALTIAERLRERVATTPSITPDGETHFTVSIGLSALNVEDPSHETIIQRADDALYQAKHAGRNRVCVWTAEETGPNTF